MYILSHHVTHTNIWGTFRLNKVILNEPFAVFPRPSDLFAIQTIKQTSHLLMALKDDQAVWTLPSDSSVSLRAGKLYMCILGTVYSKDLSLKLM